MTNILDVAETFLYDAEKEELVGKCGQGRLSLVAKGSGRVFCLGKQWQLSRVVWAVAKKEDPGNCLIRHINGDEHDNRPGNLRKLTRMANARLNGKRASLPECFRCVEE